MRRCRERKKRRKREAMVKGRKEAVKRVQRWEVSPDRSPALTRTCIPSLGTAPVLQVGADRLPEGGREAQRDPDPALLAYRSPGPTDSPRPLGGSEGAQVHPRAGPQPSSDCSHNPTIPVDSASRGLSR